MKFSFVLYETLFFIYMKTVPVLDWNFIKTDSNYLLLNCKTQLCHSKN